MPDMPCFLPKISPAAAVLALIAAAATTDAFAQERLDLAGGFQPDPAVLPYSVTGAGAAHQAVRGCPGFLPDVPALELSLSEANALVHLFLVGGGAAGLVAAGPDGVHHCAVIDDIGIAHLRFNRILSGEYRVWPAATEPGAVASGTLLVSEIELGLHDVVNFTGLEVDPALLPPPPGEVALTPDAEPAAGRYAMPAEGTLEVPVALASGVSADDAGQDCSGVIDPAQPALTLTLETSEPLLVVAATSQIDTTLVVTTPAGEVFCNDDAFNYDPAVVVPEAAPGVYAVWVGMLSDSPGAPATVTVGREMAAPHQGGGAIVELDTSAEPALGRHEFPAGARLELSLTLAAGTAAANVSGACSGEIDPARPDAVVRLAGPEPVLWFHVVSDNADTTLLIVGADGAISCNDDFDGVNAALAIEPAPPGDYSVWVGAYPGQDGVPARLSVTREAPTETAMSGGGETGMPNPFAGVEVQSATQAFDLLKSALGIGDVLTFARLEETGPEGIVLHDVTLEGMGGAGSPLKIGQIRISDLDLAGLSEYGVPERFAIAIEGISYDDIVGDAQAFGVPLPAVDTTAPISLALSLLPPDGDETRREVRFGLGFEGQLTLDLAARMVWPEGAAAMGPMAAALVEGETIEIVMHDMGFLGASLRQAAAESGQTAEALIAESLDELARDLGPLPPGSARARLFEAVQAKLSDIDSPGVLSIRFRAMQPMDMDAMMGVLMAEELDESQVQLEVNYTPDQ